MTKSPVPERSHASTTALPRLLLLGGGHVHVEVIRRLGLDRKWQFETLLVSTSSRTPYSGMLPGFVAGEYGFDDIHMDLEALCAASSVTFRRGEATGLEADGRRVLFADGSTRSYDLLSLDIGSRPSLPEGVRDGFAVKPISSFVERLAMLDGRVRDIGGSLRLAVVGQGIAGVEIAFALRRRLERNDGRHNVEILLVGRSGGVIASRSTLARLLVIEELRKAGITTVGCFDAVAFDSGKLTAADGRCLDVDEVVWTTSSAAPSWLRSSGLTLDDQGFVRVDGCLRSVSHPSVFAAGDIAALHDPRPKSGVFAVRAGPILHRNLRQAARGRSLRAFRPQRHWLALISLANGSAIADKWGLATCGRWVARWKRWSDTNFVRRYRTLSNPTPPRGIRP